MENLYVIIESWGEFRREELPSFMDKILLLYRNKRDFASESYCSYIEISMLLGKRSFAFIPK